MSAPSVGVLRRHHAAVAQRPEVLGRIEAERRDLGERAHLARPDCSAVRLGAVLDHRDAMPAAGLDDRVQRDRLAVEMHRDHRADRRHARRWMRQHLRQFGGIHRVEIGLDVDQHRRGADHLDRGDRGNRGMRYRHHARARPHAQRAQRQRQRIGAVAAADRGGRAEPGGELGLERAQFLAEDVPAGLQHPRHRGIDLVPQCAIAGAGVGLWHGYRLGAHRHRLNVDRPRCSAPAAARRRRTGTSPREPTSLGRPRTAA